MWGAPQTLAPLPAGTGGLAREGRLPRRWCGSWRGPGNAVRVPAHRPPQGSRAWVCGGRGLLVSRAWAHAAVGGTALRDPHSDTPRTGKPAGEGVGVPFSMCTPLPTRPPPQLHVPGGAGQRRHVLEVPALPPHRGVPGAPGPGPALHPAQPPEPAAPEGLPEGGGAEAGAPG